MMKNAVLSLLISGFVYFMSSIAVAEPSTRICSQKTPKLCAKLEFQTQVSTSAEAQFKVSFDGSPVSTLKDLKVDLWMDMGNGHGHGSSPVEVAALNATTYQVKNAWFVMAGRWLVRLHFTANGASDQIDFPIAVSQ